MRRAILPAVLVLASACGRPPVEEEVTIAFAKESSLVTVTAQTTLETTPRTDAARKRVDAAREAILVGTDPWSVRFGRLSPDSERRTLQRDHGALSRVTHSVVLPADDLPRAFTDVSATFTVMRGEGWRELAIYPGNSSRATREQQRYFDEALDAWSHDVARYFASVRHLYRYLDENPGRAKDVFAAVVAGKENDAPPLTEDEEPLVGDVLESMVAIAAKMDEQNARAESLAETADLIFNPFPARMIIHVPGGILASEGFSSKLVIEPVDLMKAVAGLEGRWIAPDPLAALLRDEIPAPAQLEAMPRRAEPVSSASDISAALREQLARPRAYVVRWRD